MGCVPRSMQDTIKYRSQRFSEENSVNSLHKLLFLEFHSRKNRLSSTTVVLVGMARHDTSTEQVVAKTIKQFLLSLPAISRIC